REKFTSLPGKLAQRQQIVQRQSTHGLSFHVGQVFNLPGREGNLKTCPTTSSLLAQQAKAQNLLFLEQGRGDGCVCRAAVGRFRNRLGSVSSWPEQIFIERTGCQRAEDGTSPVDQVIAKGLALNSQLPQYRSQPARRIDSSSGERKSHEDQRCQRQAGTENPH